ncbi:MAG: hypothetical protein ACFCD0_03260 [Gemmataceae bacterium]
MRPRMCFCFVVLVTAFLAAESSVTLAQAPKKPTKRKAKGLHYEGEIKFGLHTLKLQEGRCYTIQAITEGFSPTLRMIDGKRALTVNYRYSKVETKRVHSFQCIPPVTKDYKLLVSMNGFAKSPETSKYPYEVRVTSTKPLVAVQERLDQSDPLHPTTKGFCKAYEFPLEQGFAYRVIMSSNQMNPTLYLEDSEGNSVTQGPNFGNYSYVHFTPKKSGRYRMLASSYGKRYGYYTLMLTKLSPTRVLFSKKGKLTDKDKTYRYRNAFYKTHKVKLKAGESYQIEMSSRTLTPYLYVEDTKGKLVTSGGRRVGPEVHLIFTPVETGEYRIIATTSRAGVKGEYTVSVQEGAFNMNSVAPPVLLPAEKAPVPMSMKRRTSWLGTVRPQFVWAPASAPELCPIVLVTLEGTKKDT